MITTHKGKILVAFDSKTGAVPAKAKPKARQVSGPPKTSEERQIDDLRDEKRRYKEGGLEQLALKEEEDKQLDVEELKIMAKKKQLKQIGKGPRFNMAALLIALMKMVK